MKNLIDEAIDASMEFEELMDKTDFDSWFENEDPAKFADIQDVAPFKKFGKNIAELKEICNGMIKEEDNQSAESVDKSSLKKHIVKELFDAKFKRVEARICPIKEDGEGKYKEAQYCLLSALNQLHLHKQNSIEKKLWILLYNDLSICYAGLENSSMSRAYAEEARKMIEKEKSYKEFEQKFSDDNSTEMAGIANDEFVTTKLYVLYTVAIFNQAVAEKRSHYYTDAEKNFRRIIDYVERGKNIDTPLRNFNYYSALLNLSDLYMDLSRGKEAIELLDRALNNKNKLDELDENDIRYWNVILAWINALIDQSEYKKAKYLLLDKKILTTGNELTLNKKHRITSTGFKGLNCFVRCTIENARDELKMNHNKTEGELKQAENFINENKIAMKERDPEGSGLKVYKQLSDIYIILNQDEKIIDYLIKFISQDHVDLKGFTQDPKIMGDWVYKCDDFDVLENFTDQVIKKVIKDKPDESKKNNYRDLLGKIKKKIIEEGENKGQPARAERIARRIKVVIEKVYEESLSNLLKKIEKKIIEEGENKGQSARAERIVRKIMVAIKECKEKDYKEFPSHLIYEDICKRLDINEQEFDRALYKRSEIKENHKAEVIILRRWNSYSPGLFQESKGSLGGGYLLRIKRNSYLFSFSDIVAKENERQKLLNFLHDLGLAKLAKILEGAKYSKEEEEIRITRNNNRIATLKIKEGLCYLECDYHDEFKIGIVKEKDHKQYIYSEDSDIENIVIDPGYNFIQSFRNEDFHVDDIDTIIITHSHLDHCAELLPIMDLIFQFNKRYEDTPNEERQKKKVNLYLSKGAYKKFSTYIDPDWRKQLKDVVIIENLENMKCDLFDGLTISAIQTPHIDLGGAHSIGLKIEIIREKKNLCFGFTSDTPWDLEIREFFKGCDLLCVHLGSMKYTEIGYKDKRYKADISKRKISSGKLLEELRKTYTEANHLLFHGTLDFIECWSDKNDPLNINNPLIIVGEFGEELKYDLRTSICDELRKEVNKNREEKEEKIVCLPGDIGLYISIDEDGMKKVRCNFCDHFVEPEEIKTFSYGREDAIHYMCKTCHKTLTDLQKQAIIEHRVTRH